MLFCLYTGSQLQLYYPACKCVGSDCLKKVVCHGCQTLIRRTYMLGKLINVCLHIVKSPLL